MFEDVYGNDDGAEARIVHHIALGIDPRHVEPPTIDIAINAIKNGITRLSGGVSVLMGEGTWTPGSELGNYSGAVERDLTVNFILTLTPREHDVLWPEVRNVIAHVVQRSALGCVHIHVMIWRATSKIFRIEPIGKRPALAAAE